MAIIPYRVDVPYDRRPVMNWLLVASVIGAFGLQIAALSQDNAAAVETFVLDGWGIQGLIGHMWLHGDLFHIGGNMLFLWLFGNAVCAKIGNLKYLPIYLMLGIVAGITQLIFDGSPTIGASGAINGIVGMFLVYFWENEIDCIFIMSLYYVREFSVSSFWMIGLWLLYDIAGVVMGGEGIAYFAHLGGFFMGIVTAIVLLKLNLVTMYRDEESLVQRLETWLQDRRDAKLEALARDEVDRRLAKEPVRQPAAVKAAAGPARAPEMVQFRCQCGKLIKAPIHLAGRKGRCPQCRQEVIVPEPKGLPPVIN